MIKMHGESHFHHPGPLSVLLQPELPTQVSLLLFNASVRYAK